MPVTIELTPDLETRLRQEAARHGLDPQAYIARALEELLQPHANGGNGAKPPVALPPREAELLQRINAGLPADVWARYRDLIRQRDDGTLSGPEQATLIELSDRIEEAHASRLSLAAELALLRGVPLDALLRQLGLPGKTRA